MKKLTALMGLVVAAFSINSHAAEIVADNYDVTGTGSGFNLGSGVNSGINPPTTRLTGSAAGSLRYIKTSGAKADSAHTITGNKFQVARIATDSSTISLSGGVGAYDFGSVLNTLAATPAEPSVYEVTISIANGAAGAQRCSFAISSTVGTANSWDFGIQLYRPSGAINYTVQKRVSTAAGGLAAVVNEAIVNEVGVYPGEVSFLLRITDAGAETQPSNNSKIEVALVSGGTTNWIYDTSSDSVHLPNGWRFPGASRFFMWDIAGGAGPVTYDDFSVNYISGPMGGVTRIWDGEGADDNWSTAANWNGAAPASGDSLVFNGTNRQFNNNDITDLMVPTITFNNGGFQLAGNKVTVTDGITNLEGNNAFVGGLNWFTASTKAWNISAGSEVALNNYT
ncbi:MAG: hypothetical protein ACK4UN_11760, partial [Limisphaerales bacterium]